MEKIKGPSVGLLRTSDRAGRVSKGAGRASDRVRGPQRDLEEAQRELGGPQRELRGPWEAGALRGCDGRMDSLLSNSNRAYVVVP